MSNIIEVSNLVKNFGDFSAVNNISFNVEKGSLFGFLGINGAGKSTTISILCTLSEKTKGSVKVCGYDVGKDDSLIRSKIGVVFQDNSLDDRLTVKQNLILRGSLYENNKKILNENINQICDDLKINHLLNSTYKDLSGGQKRICDVARALIHKPEILFLDEPTTGLDPKTRRTLWESIEKIRRENNMTVFLTTHYMEEAAKADKIAVMNKGRIVAEGTPFKIKELYSKDKLKIEYNNKEAAEAVLRKFGLKYYDFENRINIEIPDTMFGIKILKELQEDIDSFEVVQGTIEDAFLNITGNTLKEA